MIPDLRPMLATSWPHAFDDPDWWFEVKWDGYRVLVHSEEGMVRLRSRRGNDLTDTFPEIEGPRETRSLVLDGEIVVFDDDGVPSFHRLQQRNGLYGTAARERAARHPATVVVFDLLADERLVVDEPYERRRARLESLDLGTLVASRPIRGEGLSLWDAIHERGLEGMVAKRFGSLYRPGQRSADWRKITRRRTMNAVVGGFLPGEGARLDRFGSVLIGLRDDDGALRFVGAVGSGFTHSDLEAMHWAMRELQSSVSPFADTGSIPRGAVWVQPGIVIRVEYKEVTPDGRLRAPVFKGASDVPPEEVTWSAELR